MATCAACGLEIVYRSEIRAAGHFILHKTCVDTSREIWQALRPERELERARRDLFEKQEQLGTVRQDRVRLEVTERMLRRRVDDLQQSLDDARSRGTRSRNRADELAARVDTLTTEVERLTSELARQAVPAPVIATPSPVAVQRASEGSGTSETVEHDDSTTRYSLLELDT